MERDLADEYREADSRGARRRIALRALVDVLSTAPAELARELGQDLRHALRIYGNSLWGTAIAVATLSTGTAFVFVFLSLYVDLLLRPHPGFEDSARIATIGLTGDAQLVGLPFLMVERMADEMNSVDVVASAGATRVLIGRDREEAGMEMVSTQFFEGLRPRLALGRGFSSQDHAPDAEPVAVISHRLWQSRFGGRSEVLDALLEVTRDPREVYTEAQPIDSGGQSGIMLVPGGEPAQQTTQFRIVGVMADSLRGLAQAETAIWAPTERAFPLFVGSERLLEIAPAPTYVRKRAGVETMAVLGEVDARYGELLANINLDLDVMDGVFRDFNVQRSSNRQLNMFLTGSILLALAAAANVSLFLFARAPGRRRELGIRMAVGAPVRRLARQLASEASLLVIASAAIGLAISVWLGSFLRGLTLFRDAEWRQVTLLDWRVLTLIGAFLLVLCLLVSLAPIVGLKRQGIGASSRTSTSRATLAQRLAGTAQCAAAGALGAAAIAFGWHLVSLTYGDPGYQVADRYAVRFDIPQTGIRDADGGSVPVVRLREIIESIPGVTAVAFGSSAPTEEPGGRFVSRIPDPTDPLKELNIRRTTIDSRYIETLGLTLIHGRAPEDSERDVVLLNQSLARVWWGREDVVGETLPFSIPYLDEGATVIGVLEDLSFGHPAATVVPRTFTISPHLSQAGVAVIETRMTAAALRQELERMITSGDLEIPITDVLSLKNLRDDVLAADRARGALTIATAALVVLLSAFGFYGTQRYLVVAGRREYAIRASLGAGPGALGRLVIRRGLFLGMPGLVVGGLLAFIFVAWLRDGLVSREVSPGAVTIAVVAGLAVLLYAASLAPARIARRTQPASLLRED